MTATDNLCQIFGQKTARSVFSEYLPDLIENQLISLEMGLTGAEFMVNKVTSCQWVKVNEALGCASCNTSQDCLPQSFPACPICVPAGTLTNQTLEKELSATCPAISGNQNNQTLALFWSIVLLLTLLLGCVALPYKFLALLNQLLSRNDCYRTTQLWLRYSARRFGSCFNRTRPPPLTWAQIYADNAAVEPICSCCAQVTFECLARTKRLPPNVSRTPFQDLITNSLKVLTHIENRTNQEVTLNSSFEKVAGKLQSLILEVQRQLLNEARASVPSPHKIQDDAFSSTTYSSACDSLLRGSTMEMHRLRGLESRQEDVEADIKQLGHTLIHVAGSFDLHLQENDSRSASHRLALTRADDNFSKLMQAMTGHSKITYDDFNKQYVFLKELTLHAESQNRSGCLGGKRKLQSDLLPGHTGSFESKFSFPTLSPILNPQEARPTPYVPLRLGTGAFSFLAAEQLKVNTESPRLPKTMEGSHEYHYYNTNHNRSSNLLQTQGKLIF